jgi:hypothetical protein
MRYSREEWLNRPKHKRIPNTYTSYNGCGWSVEKLKENYSFITNNYNEIISLLIDNEYGKIFNLLGFGPTIANDMAKPNLSRTLINYCVEETDMKMFNVLMDSVFFGNDKTVIHMLLCKVARHDNSEMFKIIIDDDMILPFLDSLIDIIMVYPKNPTKFIIMIVNKGVKFSDADIQKIINSNTPETLQYIIDIGYDVQRCFDNMTDIYLTLPSLKILHNNINISKQTNKIYLTQVYDEYVNELIFLLDNFPDLDLIKGFNKACLNDQIEVMKLFLGKGLSIHDIEQNENLKYIDFKTAKFLIDCGYPIQSLNLNMVLLKVFNGSKDITELYYLVDNRADITVVIDDKQNLLNTESENQDELLMVKSNIENVIYNGLIDRIKFLIDNYYDLMQQKISDMFVIACANGKVDIAKYLLGYDVQMNNKSLVASCFFGHYEIVLMLLELGMNFEDVNENLFDVVIFGMNCINIGSDIYDRLVDGDDIFQNDLYEWGKEHYKIIQLLMKHNLSVGKCNFLSKIWGHDLCNVEFYKYIMMNVEDVNEKFGGMTLLESSIRCRNEEVTEMLLKYGMSLMNPIMIVPSSVCDENMKKLLLKYGQEVNDYMNNDDSYDGFSSEEL